MNTRPNVNSHNANHSDFPQTNSQLESEVTQLAGNLNADNYQFLIRIAELDRREAWRAWGCRSCAYWLNWKCGIALNAARERLRTAHALAELPRISAAFASGKLSYSKARAITRRATPENEKFFLQIARFGTASHLAKLVRQYELVSAEQSQAQQVNRGLNYFWNDDGSLVAQVVLPAEQGALFLKALGSAVEALEQDDWQPDTALEDEVHAAESNNEKAPAGAFSADVPEKPEWLAQRRADGLVMMAESQLTHLNSTSKTADRYQVVVHADVSGELPHYNLENGPALAVESVKRLCCDASVSQIVSAEGEPVSIGRKSRTIPAPLRRALMIRDEGCKFPGCNSTRFVDGHHLHHWADGGETSLENLVLLCRFHHRLVHEGGFSVSRLTVPNPCTSNRFEFHRPDGELIPQTSECKTATPATDNGKEKPKIKNAWQWNGDNMDYGMAIDNLVYLDRRRKRNS